MCDMRLITSLFDGTKKCGTDEIKENVIVHCEITAFVAQLRNESNISPQNTIKETILCFAAACLLYYTEFITETLRTCPQIRLLIISTTPHFIKVNKFQNILKSLTEKKVNHDAEEPPR